MRRLTRTARVMLASCAAFVLLTSMHFRAQGQDTFSIPETLGKAGMESFYNDLASYCIDVLLDQPPEHTGTPRERRIAQLRWDTLRDSLASYGGSRSHRRKVASALRKPRTIAEVAMQHVLRTAANRTSTSWDGVRAAVTDTFDVEASSNARDAFFYWLCSSTRMRNQQGALRSFRDAGVRFLGNRPFAANEERLAVDMLRTGLPLSPEACASLLDAWHKVGGMTDWTRHFLLGERYGIAASSALARASSPAEEENARALLEKAIELLLEAHAMRTKYPEAAQELMQLSFVTGELIGGKDASAWFDEALAAQFDWMPVYHDVVKLLMMRGSDVDRSLFAFAMQCAATERYDTDVPWVLVEVMQQMVHRRGSTRILAYPGLFEALETVVQNRSEDASEDNVNRAGIDAMVSSAAFENGNWHGAADYGVRSLRASYTRWRDHLERYHGFSIEAYWEAIGMSLTDSADEIERADRLRDDGNEAGALAIYERVRDEAPDHPFVRKVIDERIAALTWPRKFANGEWVEVGPAPGLGGWNALTPVDVEEVEDGWVRLQPELRTSLVLDQWFEPPFVIEGEFRLLKIANDGKKDLRFGLLDDGEGRQELLTLTFGDNGALTHEATKVSGRNARTAIRLGTGEYLVRLEVAPEKIRMLIDEQIIFAAPPLRAPPYRGRFVLEVLSNHENTLMRNLRVQRMQ